MPGKGVADKTADVFPAKSTFPTKVRAESRLAQQHQRWVNTTVGPDFPGPPRDGGPPVTAAVYRAGMTLTETSPTARNGRKRPSDETPALTDQIVMSGAGLTSQGITTALRLADGAVTTVDTLVLGTFDLAEQVVGSTLVSDLVSKSIGVARQSWQATVETYRETMAAF
jgi:hypothetical protein